MLLGEKWVWGLGWNMGGGLTYPSFVRVVLPVMATAIASLGALNSNLVGNETKTWGEGFEDG